MQREKEEEKRGPTWRERKGRNVAEDETLEKERSKKASSLRREGRKKPEEVSFLFGGSCEETTSD